MAKYCPMCNAVTNCTDNCTECLREEQSNWLKELIDEKVNEIFFEYQKANNITNGDIEPMDALKLDEIEGMLKIHIEYVCSKQKGATK